MGLGEIACTLSITFTAVAGFFTVLRCISRFVIVRKAGVDDIVALIAYLSSVGTTVFIYRQYLYGLGTDVEHVSPRNLVEFLKSFWISIIFYGIAMPCIKISALLQYLRFVFDTGPKIATWTILAVVTAFGVAGLVVDICGCWPIAFTWDKTIPGGRCINLLVWWYSAMAFSILTDIVVVALPIIVLKNLNMPRGQKQALLTVFALGGFDCLISVFRVHAVCLVATSENITRDNAAAAWWSSLELNIGIICICLPPLKALVVAVFPRLRANGYGSHSQSQGQEEHDLVRLCTTTSTKNHSSAAQPETLELS